MKERIDIAKWRPEDVTAEWEIVTLAELARACGIHPDIVDSFLTLGIIEPVSREPVLEFDTTAILRIRRTIRMRRDLGVNYASAGIILDLVDEIDTLRDRIQELEQEIERTRS